MTVPGSAHAERMECPLVLRGSHRIKD